MNDLLGLLSSRLALHVDSVNAMGSAAMLVHSRAGQGLAGLAFEEQVQSFFFVSGMEQLQSFHMHLSLRVVLDRDAGARMSGVARLLRQQVEYLFIVNLKEADMHRHVMIIMLSNFHEHLVDGPWYYASILEVRRGSIHGESLAGAGLPIAHDASVIAVGDLLHHLLRAVAEDVLLGGVVHDLVKFEFPGFLNVIYETSTGVFRNVHCSRLGQAKKSKVSGVVPTK